MTIPILQILVIWGLFLIKNSKGYPDGAPTEACFNFRPGHGFDFSMQVDYRSYYTLSTRPTGRPDKSLKVILKAVRSDRLFKGFLIRAIPGSLDLDNWEDEPQPVGSWRENPDTRLISCFRGENNAITHVDNDDKVEASFVWVPPKSGNQSVSFVATVVENRQRYFSGVESDLVDAKDF